MAALFGMLAMALALGADVSSNLAYPPEVEKLIAGIEPVICGIESQSKTGIKVYRKGQKRWLVRIFVKNGAELEIWLNYDETMMFAFYFPDKIFYLIDGANWMDKDSIAKETADELDGRLKFTAQELQMLSACFKQKIKDR